MQSDDFQRPDDIEYRSEGSGDERIFAVADHGVDPSPMKPVSYTSNGSSAAKHKAADHGESDGSFGWRDALLWCGIPILIFVLLRVFLFGFYVIPSGSMLDTIEIKDRVIATKLTPKYFDLQRGDIVVFHDPANWLTADQKQGGDDYLIKRVIGIPGDVVECAGAGEPVKVNGVAIDETSYIRPGVDPSNLSFRVEVTAGHIFVMGDNRANSSDSRYHQDDGSNGLVPINNVVGVAFLRYWPLSRFGLLDSHHDTFDDVPAGTSAQ